MAGDVGRTEHLPTDATGDLAFMPDHVGTESVFGGESRGAGLQSHSRRGQSQRRTTTTTTSIIIIWKLTVMTLTVT